MKHCFPFPLAINQLQPVMKNKDNACFIFARRNKMAVVSCSYIFFANNTHDHTQNNMFVMYRQNVVTTNQNLAMPSKTQYILFLKKRYIRVN